MQITLNGSGSANPVDRMTSRTNWISGLKVGFEWCEMTPVGAGNVNSILLADDDEHDVFFMRRAIASAGLEIRLYAVQDGERAIEYLSGGGVYADRLCYPIPYLLVTDIKMPRVNGFELLAWLQTRSEFASMPKLVMSSSCHEADLKRSRDLGAAGYFTKPSVPQQLVAMVRNWHRDWMIPHCSPAGLARNSRNLKHQEFVCSQPGRSHDL